MLLDFSFFENSYKSQTDLK